MIDTTKDITLNDFITTHIENIKKAKQDNPQINVVDFAQTYIADNITTKQVNKYRGVIADIYTKLADIYDDKTNEFKELAKKNNPYLITNLNDFDRYLKSYNESNNYNCRLFPKSNYEKLVFAPATIGFIGARTSRGKTTALVSTAIDALEQNKRVFFTTMEESQYQIELRFILHFLFNDGYYAGKENGEKLANIENWHNELKNTKFNPKRTILKILRGDPVGEIFNDTNLTKQFIQNVAIAKETLNTYLINGKLAIYNGMESPSFEYMIDAMTDNDAGDIVLLDYVQKVKAPAKYAGSENRFTMLQNATQELANATKRTNIILISGAQFGRTGEKTKSNVLDMFTDESFQECSAIEQAGEIEIGIGRHFNKGIKHTYYSILKDRDNGEYNPNVYYELEDIAKFSTFTPKRRTEKKDNVKEYSNLIEYYNVDTDIIDGETIQARNKRIYGTSNSKRKANDTDEKETPATSENEKPINRKAPSKVF